MENKNLQCKGCKYEFADESTTAILNCVCCKRNIDIAKYDNYKRMEKN